MQRQASLNTDPPVPGTLSEPYTSFLPESTHSYLVPGGGAVDVMNFDMNSWPSTVESFANTVQPERNIDAVLHELMGRIDQLEEYQNSNPTNPILTFSTPGASPSAQLASPEAPSINPHTDPMIRSEHQSYLCSWHLHDSGSRCNHLAPDRLTFLHHLGERHQVSGDPDAAIICQLSGSQMGSACNMPIKRGNFPRHVDTHYRLRYHCQHCPAGKSFSRQDSWRKHSRDKHP